MKIRPPKYFVPCRGLGAALPAMGRLAWAEAYPTKPIRLIVPVPPAGTFDIVARLVSNELSQRLGSADCC